MEELFFPTCYFPNLHEKEPGGGILITEQAGYVPADVLIKNMILSGERLQLFRDAEFDVSPGEVKDDIEDLNVVPTRRLDFDMSEASVLQDELYSRFLKAKAESKAEKKPLDNSIDKETEVDKKIQN